MLSYFELFELFLEFYWCFFQICIVILDFFVFFWSFLGYLRYLRFASYFLGHGKIKNTPRSGSFILDCNVFAKFSILGTFERIWDFKFRSKVLLVCSLFYSPINENLRKFKRTSSNRFALKKLTYNFTSNILDCFWAN